ncbi:FAD-dependent oxidoreductase [Streptomyces sp. NPDC058632]|uniref:FAD-dependent oxidoreductase n=1 Tax=unclassified Streptomyces TaxID=2593676 RepID=UPI003668567F
MRISAPADLQPGWHTRPPPRIAVVGGGIAGVTAAVALAERGMAVDLFEQRPYPGGRLAGWPTELRDGSTTTMSRGFHAFFRQYYNLRALLRRIDPGLDILTSVPDYPLLHNTGHTDTFAGLPTTPPWNAAAFMMRSSTFRAADLRTIDRRAALQLFDVDVPQIYRRLDHLDARTFRHHRTTARAQKMTSRRPGPGLPPGVPANPCPARPHEGPRRSRSHLDAVNRRPGRVPPRRHRGREEPGFRMPCARDLPVLTRWPATRCTRCLTPPATRMTTDKAQRQLTYMQWAVPALTGCLVVLNALHGEQQRPNDQLHGMLQRMRSVTPLVP